jgi:hypothetical protein
MNKEIFSCNWCQGTTEHKSHCQAPRVELDGKDEPTYWNIRLNKYQRDNLLWLFSIIGYPYGEAGTLYGQVEPFHLANTGDWVGEIPNMLARPGGKILLDDNKDHPNTSTQELRTNIERWVIAAKIHLT